MALTAQQLVTLKNEITTDPLTIGYAGKQDGDVATLLNDPTKGGNIDRTTVDAATLQSAVVTSEYAALSQVARDQWRDIITASQRGVPMKSTGLRAQIAALWTAGASPNTRAALVALQQRPGSRAEALFGDGTVIDASEVAKAKLS